MFETLTEKLSRIFSKLKNHGRLDDTIIEEALREVRVSLLEADVNFKVVKEFTARVAERARGREVMGSLTPAQQVIKIVRDELTAVLGDEAVPLARAKHPPVCVMLVGLQGSGKTTSIGKLARYLRFQGQGCLLVACDIHRPAAVDQLVTVGAQVEVEVVAPAAGEGLPALVGRALNRAAQMRSDYVLFDTAGRLHIDREMMDEAAELARLMQPQEVLLVADAMTGQDAVNVAKGFGEVLPLTGIILTKFDGDARGGAALSMRQVTGVPVKFIGVGEKLDALEVFHPARLVSRILGMGDVLTLIERAEQAVDKEQVREFGRKIRQNQFTLEDFRENLKMMKKMGSMEELLALIPGVGKAAKGLQVEEGQIKRVEAIINSMTPGERRDYKILNTSRRQRIATGSGTDVQEVHRLIKQFEKTRLMMKQMGRMGKLAGSMNMGRGLSGMR